MEFDFNNNTYATGKLSAFSQLHLARRFTPLLGGLAELADSNFKINTDYKPGDSMEDYFLDMEGDLGKAIEPLCHAIADLNDEDVEYVINACLDVCLRKQTGGNTGWAPLRNNNALMYDISLPLMLIISAHTIRENLTDFFSELPSIPGMGELMKKAFPGQSSPEKKTG